MPRSGKFTHACRGDTTSGALGFHDYFRDPRFTLPDFADGDHLSPEGADRFSHILDAEVVRPLLQLPPQETGSAAPATSTPGR